MRELTLTVGEDYDQVQLQDFLRTEHHFSRRLMIKLKANPPSISCNGKHIRMVDRVSKDDVVTVRLYDDTSIVPNDKLNVPIMYEDEDVVVYNKPQNMPTHPSKNHYDDTLGNQFVSDMNKRGMQTTFRPINRLDTDTYGLCVVAKNALSASMLTKNMTKTYTALVDGVIYSSKGTINIPIERENYETTKRVTSFEGQHAVTHFEVLKRNTSSTLVRVKLETGRTHQIRVHFKSIGHTLLGDDMYGGDCTEYKYQQLCCSEVQFENGITKQNVVVTLEGDLQLI